MKRLAILAAGIALLVIVSPLPAAAAGTAVTGAGGGVFPPGTLYSGVRLDGLRFGMGVAVAGGGSAEGPFQTTLIGVSALGQPQYIQVEGNASGGSAGTGTAAFSGSCSIDMGDGTLPVQNVPFTVTVTTNQEGRGTLGLVLGLTSLPAATVNEGSMTIQ